MSWEESNWNYYKNGIIEHYADFMKKKAEELKNPIKKGDYITLFNGNPAFVLECEDNRFAKVFTENKGPLLEKIAWSDISRYASNKQKSKRPKFEIRDIGLTGKEIRHIYPLPNFATVKVLSVQKSNTLFGNNKNRSGLVGNYYKDFKIDKDYLCKDEVNRDTILITNGEGRYMRVLIEEIMFKEPNWKGFNKPKDKTLGLGSLVKPTFKNPLYGKEEKTFKVSNIKNSSYLGRISKSSLLTLVDKKGNTYQVRNNHLKVISND